MGSLLVRQGRRKRKLPLTGLAGGALVPPEPAPRRNRPEREAPGQIRHAPRHSPRLRAVRPCDAGKHCLMCAVRIPIRASTARTATWRSGYATVCKTVYPGSIPGVASSLRSLREPRLGKPDWGGEAEKRAFAAFNAGRALLYAPHSHEQAIPR
jgi:hypothetical protein